MPLFIELILPHFPIWQFVIYKVNTYFAQVWQLSYRNAFPQTRDHYHEVPKIRRTYMTFQYK